MCWIIICRRRRRSREIPAAIPSCRLIRPPHWFRLKFFTLVWRSYGNCPYGFIGFIGFMVFFCNNVEYITTYIDLIRLAFSDFVCCVQLITRMGREANSDLRRKGVEKGDDKARKRKTDWNNLRNAAQEQINPRSPWRHDESAILAFNLKGGKVLPAMWT